MAQIQPAIVPSLTEASAALVRRHTCMLMQLWHSIRICKSIVQYAAAMLLEHHRMLPGGDGAGLAPCCTGLPDSWKADSPGPYRQQPYDLCLQGLE